MGKQNKNEKRLSLVSDYNGQDVRGWLVSRKYNGWRCTYCRSEGLRTRGGQTIIMPEWFAEELYKLTTNGMEVDGELTYTVLGVEQPTKISTASVNPDWDGWRDIRFRPFAIVGSKESRIQQRDDLVYMYRDCKYVHPVAQYPKPSGDMVYHAQRMIECGWEGIVLTNPQATYRAGRNTDMLRIKRKICDKFLGNNA